jgi:ribose transport system permease protein
MPYLGFSAVKFAMPTVIHSVSGAMSAMSGMLLLGFSGGGFVGAGDPYLFSRVAAVVIGGTPLLVGLGLSFPAQQAVVGLLIVPMVAIYARSPHIRNQI